MKGAGFEGMLDHSFRLMSYVMADEAEAKK